ncbi:MAG TPA: GFA family protein [Thermoanaerobaculia bacterium]|nr:GFA family protein [Thermoanaerobaculia bacterium]
MLTATCHCGAVRVEVPRRPRTLTDCNCSICRRYGALWAYYEPSTVRVVAAPGTTSGYSWGSKTIRFVHCTTCGCVTHYLRIKTPGRRMGVNARHLEPADLGAPRIRRLDGARTWRSLE